MSWTVMVCVAARCHKHPWQQVSQPCSCLGNPRQWSRWRPQHVGARVRVSKRQICPNVVHLISLRENLGAELAAEIAVGGELGDQDALVVATQAVDGQRRYDVPSAANAIVHNKSLSSFKGIGP